MLYTARVLRTASIAATLSDVAWLPSCSMPWFGLLVYASQCSTRIAVNSTTSHNHSEAHYVCVLSCTLRGFDNERERDGRSVESIVQVLSQLKHMCKPPNLVDKAGS